MREKTYLRALSVFPALFVLAVLSACDRDDAISCDGDPPEITRPDFWTKESHCRGILPNYDEVFNEDVLHIFNIEIERAEYDRMMEDMEQFSGSFDIPDLDGLPAPIFVPVNITYNGKLWTKVGMRWKGHASLQGAWNQGIRKLAFILDFDYYEEADPDLVNQRFFGFKRLVFSNAYNDPSFIREKVAGDIFRAAGVPTARSAFAPVYMDWGDGQQYLGLYTMIEDPSDEMLEVQFGADTGSLYKPWENAARWLAPDLVYSWQEEELDGGVVLDEWGYSDWEDDIAEHFERANTGVITDWSDIKKVIKELHEDRDVPEVWRAHLEEVFNVQSFIKALAVNQAIMNWDSYGCMHHNYYVYANPLDSWRFAWFPWDFNEAMMDKSEPDCPPPGSVMLDEIVYPDEDTKIDADWPLIQFILADPVYRAEYKEEIKAVLDGAFAIDKVHAMMDKHHDLVAPYVIGPKEKEKWKYTTCFPTDCSAFADSLTEGEGALKPHVEARHEAVKAALGM
jgi:spore coat protein H